MIVCMIYLEITTFTNINKFSVYRERRKKTYQKCIVNETIVSNFKVNLI